MPITREDLAAPVTSVQVIPMIDDKNVDVFGVMLRWPSGGENIWWFEAPKVPITEGVVRKIHGDVIQRILEDLRDGRSEGAGVKPSRKKFRDFVNHDRSITGSIRRALEDWVNARLARYRKASLLPNVPIEKQYIFGENA